jgi:small nuclear ribonucleoprotein G
MVRAGGPDLKRYMDKKLTLKINGNRVVRGVLRGYDQFMNIVLDEAVEVREKAAEEQSIGMIVIRGNSVIRFEVLDPVKF